MLKITPGNMLRNRMIDFRRGSWTRFRTASSGAVNIEYALLIFLIGVVLIGVLEAIGISIIDILKEATTGIDTRPEA
jgi:Flp pilus assembly pilin Flp